MNNFHFLYDTANVNCANDWFLYPYTTGPLHIFENFPTL